MPTVTVRDMTGPKHLWAGDWKHESPPVSRDDGRAAASLEPVPDPGNEPAGARWRSRRLAVAVVAALVVITGAALGVSSLAGSGKPRRAPLRAQVPFGAPQPNSGVQTIPLPQSPTVPHSQTIPQQIAPQPASPSGGSTSPPATNYNGPAVYWLGMQIQTIEPGNVVIGAVTSGSEADQAMVEPGGQVLAVNGHSLGSATDIASAIRGLPAGHRVTVELSYGSSSPVTITLTLGAPPSRHP